MDISSPSTLNQQQRIKLICEICELLDNKYVYSEIAQKMIAFLDEVVVSGVYEDAVTSLEFAEKLTTDLQAVGHDRHFNVVYDPKRTEQLLEAKDKPDEPDEAWVERQRARNFGFEKLERLKGNIGYLDLRFFSAPEMLVAHLTSVQAIAVA